MPVACRRHRWTRVPALAFYIHALAGRIIWVRLLFGVRLEWENKMRKGERASSDFLTISRVNDACVFVDRLFEHRMIHPSKKRDYSSQKEEDESSFTTDISRFHLSLRFSIYYLSRLGTVAIFFYCYKLLYQMSL